MHAEILFRKSIPEKLYYKSLINLSWLIIGMKNNLFEKISLFQKLNFNVYFFRRRKEFRLNFYKT